MPAMHAYLRQVLATPLAVVTMPDADDPATWAPQALHTNALLQDVVLRWALRANATVVTRLEPMVADFLTNGTTPPPDLLRVRSGGSGKRNRTESHERRREEGRTQVKLGASKNRVLAVWLSLLPRTDRKDTE